MSLVDKSFVKTTRDLLKEAGCPEEQIEALLEEQDTAAVFAAADWMRKVLPALMKQSKEVLALEFLRLYCNDIASLNPSFFRSEDAAELLKKRFYGPLYKPDHLPEMLAIVQLIIESRTDVTKHFERHGG